MNIAERITRDIIDHGVAVVLRNGSANTESPVTVTDWTVRDGTGRGVAVFGPYPTSITATGVRHLYKDAVDDDVFTSPLVLPAGQTYRYTLTLGVS